MYVVYIEHMCVYIDKHRASSRHTTSMNAFVLLGVYLFGLVNLVSFLFVSYD